MSEPFFRFPLLSFEAKDNYVKIMFSSSHKVWKKERHLTRQLETPDAAAAVAAVTVLHIEDNLQLFKWPEMGRAGRVTKCGHVGPFGHLFSSYKFTIGRFWAKIFRPSYF